MAQGHRKQPQHFIQQIDQVTREDINRIGAKMLATKVSMAAIGSLGKLPSFNDVELGLIDKEVIDLLTRLICTCILVGHSWQHIGQKLTLYLSFFWKKIDVILRSV